MTSARNRSDKTQVTRALLALREQILSGQFAAGERMSELPLVERLGVSRTPLRLALVALEHEGLLDRLPAGGYTVREFTVTEIADAIELRGVLEGTAARLAAEHGVGGRELRAMSELNDEILRLINADGDYVTRYVDLNERFHARLIKLAGSVQLERMWTGIAALPFAGPSALLLTEPKLSESWPILRVAQRQHAAMLDAIAHRQGARAESVGREHARIALTNLDLLLSERETLQRMPGGSLVLLPGGAADDHS